MLRLETRTLRELIAKRGWAITLLVKALGSGASERESRSRLREVARSLGEIDAVLIWRPDRWGWSAIDLL